MSLPTLVLPGQLLGASSTYDPGPGTHLYSSNIYASLPGRPFANTPSQTASKSSKPPPKQTLAITRLPSNSATADLGPVSERISNTNALPMVGDVVLGRVTRCMTRQVNVGILIVMGVDGKHEAGMVCANEIQGVVRREDVRATEKEKVVIGERFRLGDLVRAVVVSLKLVFSWIWCSEICYRLVWAISRTIILRRRRMSWGLSWRRVNMGIRCIRSAGRSSKIR